MFDPKRMLLYYGRILLAAAIFLDLLLLLGVAAELYKERIPVTNLPHLFATPGIYLRLVRDMLPGILAVSAALFLASNFVASLYRLNSWREGIGHIWRCIFGQPSFAPSVVVSGGKVATGNDHILMRIGGPGSIVTHADSAVVLERGGRFTRVVGPGKIVSGSLEAFEKVYDVIDVRPTRWKYEVSALSKEGIPVKVHADIIFQIDIGERKSTEKTPYPASDGAIFKASTCRWMRHPESSEDDQCFDWARRVIISETEGALRGIVACYPLDALVGLTSIDSPNTRHPRKAIERKLTEALRGSAAKLGVRINKVQLGTIQVDDEVAQQWIEAWCDDWRHWALIQEKAGEAKREQLRERAKAQAQVDMITAVARSFQQAISRDARVPSQLLVMRLVEVFGRFAIEPNTRIYLPEKTIGTLKRLADLVS